jgi:hypothetical protein
MVRSRAKALVLLLLLAMLAGLPVLSGCGGGGGQETNVVVFGWMADQTGAASTAFREVDWGFIDYLDWMNENDPIPGVDIKVIRYDSRLEDARVPMGYEYLVEKGMDLLLIFSPNDMDITISNQEQDKIPGYAFTPTLTTATSEWGYGFAMSQQQEGIWIMEDTVPRWEALNMGRPMKVGHLGMRGWDTSDAIKEGIQAWIAAHPGKATFKEVTGSSSQTAWASEVAALKDMDMIIFEGFGASSATFLGELGVRGYKGWIHGTDSSFLGYLSLITETVSHQYLDGIRVPHAYPLFSDDTEYTRTIEAYLEQHRPSQVASLKGGTTYVSGWDEAVLLAAVVRKAAQDVGANNIDGTALKDALKNLDVTIPGRGGTFKMAGEYHQLFPYYRAAEYRAAENDVFTVGEYKVAQNWPLS